MYYTFDFHLILFQNGAGIKYYYIITNGKVNYITNTLTNFYDVKKKNKHIGSLAWNISLYIWIFHENLVQYWIVSVVEYVTKYMLKLWFKIRHEKKYKLLDKQRQQREKKQDKKDTKRQIKRKIKRR